MKLSNEEIAAKDLRVGNWVQPKTNHQGRFKGYRQVTTVYKEDAVVENHYPLSWFEPIPLTPEILLKGGFVGHYEGKSFGGATYSVYKLKGIWVYVYSDGRLRVYSGSGSREHKWIIYVHQLQNLYHALTGEELDLGIAISKNEVK